MNELIIILLGKIMYLWNSATVFVRSFFELQQKPFRLFTSTHVVSPPNQSLCAYAFFHPITIHVNCERDLFNLDTEVC